ncbi:MAG TPA: N-acetylmuramoyl-L-alanine amidase [Gemmatimonas sp.]|uniref:N-acetylmuramoyl-L-alanine amidase family protein n=1 Tax=Gemmatimonas sp. TaxID=1962908 RepID=UPI002ED908D5
MRIYAPFRLPLALSLAGLLLAACGAPPTPVAAPPAPAVAARAMSPVTSGLPAVPAVRGARVAINVRYPSENQVIASRDSNFLLGSVGSGDASLTVNGQPVTVAPNGAFLAWLPMPAATAARYDLVAVRGTDTVRHTLRIRMPSRTALPASGRLRVDTASLSPARGWWMRADDMVRVSIRAPRNARVTVMGRDSVVRPLLVGTGAATAVPLIAALPDTGDASTIFATDIAAALVGDSAHPARLSVSRGTGRERDSVVLAVPFVRVLPVASRLLAQLRNTSTIGSDTDRVVNARTIVGGTYKWLLLPGTVLEVTGRQQGFTRLRLDGALDVWAENGDLALLPEGAALPRRVTGGLRVTPSAEWVDLAIGTGDRPAHLVEAEGHTITLTLYGVQANPEISPIFGNDTLIRRIAWDQVSNDRVRITLTLSQPAYGWLALWDDARRAFVLRVRRVPTIERDNPLKGITIAVDPGHPPVGATGPTGLYEGDAVFPVGMKLVEMLKARGANAFSTRNSLAAVGLTDRGVIARRANAHLFISIHLNALPDGVNPFLANGTSTLFFNNTSEPLARFTQEELMRRFGLRDLGVHYQNLAVARPSWYPSALAEGLFLMLPEQEAAMRDEGFQRKYAEGLLAGVERYLKWLGEGGR